MYTNKHFPSDIKKQATKSFISDISKQNKLYLSKDSVWCGLENCAHIFKKGFLWENKHYFRTAFPKFVFQLWIPEAAPWIHGQIFVGHGSFPNSYHNADYNIEGSEKFLSEEIGFILFNSELL